MKYYETKKCRGTFYILAVVASSHVYAIIKTHHIIYILKLNAVHCILSGP